MIQVAVYKLDGSKAGTLDLDEALLGGEVRPALLKQACVMYGANRRQGTVATRNRSRVAGSTRKLYKQKGTGNARRGPIRTNLMRGGGVAFGKSTKSWRQAMPVKMRRLATRNALLSKVLDDQLKIVDRFGFDQPKTKRFAAVLKALGIQRTCLLALAEADHQTLLSARNIADVHTIPMDQLNAYDLLSRRYFLVEKKTLSTWLEALRPVNGSDRKRQES